MFRSPARLARVMPVFITRNPATGGDSLRVCRWLRTRTGRVAPSSSKPPRDQRREGAKRARGCAPKSGRKLPEEVETTLLPCGGGPGRSSMVETGYVSAKRKKPGCRSSFFDVQGFRNEHFGLACIMGLLSHGRQRPAFSSRSPARRPPLAVKLKSVTGMQAATRGQEVEAGIHEGKAGFFEDTSGGNVVDARVGENPVRLGEAEDRVGERLDGFAGEPFAPDGRRENVAELDVPPHGLCRAKEAYRLTRAALLGNRQDERRSAGVANARLHNETLRFAWRIGMRNRRSHPRDLRQAHETRDRRRVGGARPAQPKPLGFDAEDVVGGQIREHAGSGPLARSRTTINKRWPQLPFKTLSGFPDFPPEFRGRFSRRKNQVRRVRGSRWRFAGLHPYSVALACGVGWTEMYERPSALDWNATFPSIKAYNVRSVPIPTFAPGCQVVPRWRTMMLPPMTASPPNFFTPRRRPLESRPLRDEPPAFLCAIDLAPNLTQKACPDADPHHKQILRTP